MFNYSEFFEKMRIAGNLGAKTLDEVTSFVKPGTTTEYLDKICYEFIKDNGGYSAPLYYRGFPKAICTSANHIVCHGIPSEKTIVDGQTYYVTQTILGCESATLAITPQEFPCSSMGTSNVMASESMICTPGGEVTFTAESTGIGSEVYWYDDQVDGNVIGVGNSFTTNITSTTTVYAAEIFTSGAGNAGGGAQAYCVPSYSTGCTVGDNIDSFNMSSAGIIHNNLSFLLKDKPFLHSGLMLLARETPCLIFLTSVPAKLPHPVIITLNEPSVYLLIELILSFTLTKFKPQLNLSLFPTPSLIPVISFSKV